MPTNYVLVGQKGQLFQLIKQQNHLVVSKIVSKMAECSVEYAKCCFKMQIK